MVDDDRTTPQPPEQGEADGHAGRGDAQAPRAEAETEAASVTNLDRLYAVQRGEAAAITIRQLVDAQSLNFAGAGTDVFTLRYLLFGESESAGGPGSIAETLRSDRPLSDDQIQNLASRLSRAQAALDRLEHHLNQAGCKAALALDADDPLEKELHQRVEQHGITPSL